MRLKTLWIGQIVILIFFDMAAILRAIYALGSQKSR
jgi:hypothetical protein